MSDVCCVMALIKIRLVSSSNDIPMAFAWAGKSEVGVRPGKVLISKMNGPLSGVRPYPLVLRHYSQ